MQDNVATLFGRQVELLWQAHRERVQKATDYSISDTIRRFAAAGQSHSSPLYNAVAQLVEAEASNLIDAWVQAGNTVAPSIGHELTGELATVASAGIADLVETWLEVRAPALFARLARLDSGVPCRPVEQIVAAIRAKARREVDLIVNAASLRERVSHKTRSDGAPPGSPRHRIATAAKWGAPLAICALLAIVYWVVGWHRYAPWLKPAYEIIALCLAVLAWGVPLGFRRAGGWLIAFATLGGIVVAWLQFRAPGR